MKPCIAISSSQVRWGVSLLAMLRTVTLAGVGCGSTSSPTSGASSPPVSTIGMNTANFTTHSATVLVGQRVTFDDTINGGAVHILCVGSGTGGEGSDHCDSATQALNAPPVLVRQGQITMAGEK